MLSKEDAEKNVEMMKKTLKMVGFTDEMIEQLMQDINDGKIKGEQDLQALIEQRLAV